MGNIVIIILIQCRRVNLTNVSVICEGLIPPAQLIRVNGPSDATIFIVEMKRLALVAVCERYRPTKLKVVPTALTVPAVIVSLHGHYNTFLTIPVHPLGRESIPIIAR